jgi:predicted dithiol-disulfide oxidoreductase (DUF899 family)
MNAEIRDILNQIEALNLQLAEARRRAAAPRPIPDYDFRTPDGAPVRLSELFGDKRDLLIVHNMGRRCSYCTMWADGFNGLHHHLENRCAFVVASPDEPHIIREFAAGRGWKFRMVCATGSTFNNDMGFEPAPGKGVWPGVSSFHRADDGSILRISSAQFGPGDQFCPVWPLLDLLKDGPAGWEPRFEYHD